jgi:hypothetical protein
VNWVGHELGDQLRELLQGDIFRDLRHYGTRLCAAYDAQNLGSMGWYAWSSDHCAVAALWNALEHLNGGDPDMKRTARSLLNVVMNSRLRGHYPQEKKLVDRWRQCATALGIVFREANSIAYLAVEKARLQAKYPLIDL